MVFLRFWDFNTAGKTVTKVGIYSKPPLESGQKWKFIEKSRFLMIYRSGFIYHYPWLRRNYSRLIGSNIFYNLKMV
jgi:hypothetical protein